MTQRAITLADAVVAALNGQTLAGVELTGDSAPARRSHVLRDLAESGGETRPVVVSVVPRGKESTRSSRTSLGETITIAVVVQRKLDPAAAQLAQIDALAELVEAIDDHLVETAKVLADHVCIASTINPFWNVDDLIRREQFTGIVEAEFLGERDETDDE